MYASSSESEEFNDIGEGVCRFKGEVGFWWDRGQLFLGRVLVVNPLRMGSCQARAVVQVKRRGSSIAVGMSASQKKGFMDSDGTAVQVKGPSAGQTVKHVSQKDKHDSKCTEKM